MLGGVLSVTHQAIFRGGDFNLSVALMTGATNTILGIPAAIIIGAPAVGILHRLRLARLPATLLLTVGGFAFGWRLATLMFTGFEMWGGLTGASVGYMFGVLLFPRARMGISNG